MLVATSTQQPMQLSPESILQQLQELIGGPLIDQHDANLIELGLDSLDIMRLVNDWRRAGATVTFAQLIEQPKLDHWLPLLTAASGGRQDQEPFTALLQRTRSDSHYSEQPFDLTDVQYAYWIGRQEDRELGGVGCHAYLEIDGKSSMGRESVDPARLQSAWHMLIRQHSMLRARFTDDGKQFVTDAVPQPELPVHDFSALSAVDAERQTLDIRARLSHRKLDIESGQVMGLELSLLPEGKTRLHFDVDLLVADVQSLHILLRDLVTAYSGDVTLPAEKDWRFAHYLAIEAERNREQFQRDKAYWQNRLSELPTGPQLPLARDPKSIDRPEFVRRTHLLAREKWDTLRQIAASGRVTPAMVLANAYAEVLARWSAEPKFLLNIPLFDRHTDHPGIEEVVADFTNLLLLQCDCQQNVSFLTRVHALQKQFHADVTHAGYSAVRIQRDLVKQELREGVSAPVVFACNLGTPLLTEQCRSTLGDLSYMVSQTPQVWLDHQLYEMDDGLLLAWDAVEALFPDGLLDDMFAAYVALLNQLVEQDWNASLNVALPANQRAVRASANDTTGPRSEHLLHHGLFEIAGQTPGRLAVIAGETELTYGQLAEQALRIAHLLQAHGLQPGDPVAVTLPRGLTQVSAVFGVLAAGGCYVPVGVHQPAARQAKIHSAASISLVLTDAAHLTRETSDSILFLDIAQAAHYEPLATPVPVSHSQAAYIIFTSGSTGEPKGVEMAHAATANTIDAITQLYGVHAESRVLAVSALDFDLSVYDLFGVLSVGGAVVVLEEEQRRDATTWLDLIHQHHITLWNSVPVLLEMLLVVAEQDARPLPFEHVLLSGDWIGLDLPARLAAQTTAAPRLVAMGGATEAAIWSNHFEATEPVPAHWRSIPYGKPLPNQAYRVVDAHGRDCPDWVPGELWIGGVGLATGYRGDPQLTAERFVEADGQRWYRTGDRGRYWPDGNLEFLGRIDQQVKVRGHRIELGEIEAALATLPGITRAVAVTVGHPKALAAAVVATAGADLDIDSIRSALHELLPDYMVPTTLAVVDRLPLSANGKVDRQQISVQLAEVTPNTEPVLTPPQTETEHIVAALWQQLLGTEQVGRESNFFSLGGDSLLATQVITELRQQGLSASQPLRLLFAKPVLREFAAELRVVEADAQLTVVPDLEHRHEPFPLTEVQRAYWMGQSPGLPLNCGTHYLVELDGEQVDLERIEHAWNRLVQHHEMLRVVVDENGCQRILKQVSQVTIARHHISEPGERDRAKVAQQCLHDCWHQQSRQHREHMCNDTGSPSWPPYRLHAVHYGDDRCRIGIIFDYLTLDGFSIKLLLEELADLYRNPALPLPELGLSFRDYVNQVKHSANSIQKAEDYWRNRLESLPMAPELPLAIEPTALHDVTFMRRETRLDVFTWQSLKEKARTHQITPSVLLLVAYSLVIRQWSGGADHTVNLTLFDRKNVHSDINKVLGDFTSLAPVSFQRKRGDSLLEQARATQQEIADALEHREVSSIWVQRERAHRMSLTSAALPVVFTSTLGLGGGLFENPPAGFPDLVGSGLSETPQVWLDHQLYEYKGDLVLSWDAVDALFPDGLLDDMFAAYVALLNQLVEQDWNASLNVALPANQRAVRASANDTTGPRSEHLLHHGLFEIAGQTPGRLAVIAGETELTYGQLAEQALRIAHLLQAHGLQPGDPVAVTLPRGLTQVSAVFGVLAAGGCYVPVGVHQPAARQAKIHSAASISLVLTDAAHLTRETSDSILFLDIAQAAHYEPLATPVPVSHSQAAYIIFTSGSTGEPKGVEMAHAATANTIDAITQLYGVHAESRVLAVSALDFDLSVYDLFGVLSVGGAVVVLEEEQRRDATTWLDLIHQHHITLWNSVPVLLEMLLVVAEQDARPLPFEHVLLSGDWIGLDLPARLAAQTTAAPRLVAMGGATEAAIWSNHFEATEPVPAHWRSIPYGKPLPNQAYRVVDAHGRDCPDWVPGELWIGGVGLATGYRGDPQLTAERFVEADGQRWYRTGDRGRYWPDGNLEFLGRIDQQVKVRGHRIELGEIEAALATLPGITRAVAVTVGHPKALAAAVVATAGADLDIDSIRSALHELLPDYMVPTTLAVVDRLPLSANGKVDRQQISVQLAEVTPNTEPVLTPPQTETEHIVAALWQQLLGTEQVGRESNFFSLGGDSLLATQVITELRQQGLSASQPLRLLFAKPVLREFAAELRVVEADAQLTVVPDLEHRHEPFPLTEVQRAYWMGQSPGLPLNCGTHYLVELDGEQVDLERIEHAWNRLVQHHEMLRVEIDEQGHQRILAKVEPFTIETSTDTLPHLEAAREKLNQWWQHYSRHDRSTLFALKAVHYGRHNRCRLGLLFSYLTLDGFSIMLLLQELGKLYQDPDIDLPTIELSFRDYVNQVKPNPQALERAEAYWRQRLPTLPYAAALPLTCDPLSVSDVTFTRRETRIDKDRWEALRQSAHQQGVTPTVLILVAYGEIISQWSGGNPHTLNLTLFDRQAVHADIYHIVGDFTSLAPLTYSPDHSKSLLEQAQNVQRDIAEALEYREISSLWVQRERARSMGLTAAALPIVFTSTLGMSDSLFSDSLVSGFPGLASGGLSETPQVWLDHQLYEYKGDLVLSWDAVDALFPDGLLDDMFAAYVALLNQLVEQDWNASLNVALPANQRAVRASANDTTGPRSEHLLHHGLFEIAGQTPGRLAVIAGETELTYGQLAEQALRIAHLLQAHGLQPGDPVAVTLPRGLTQVSAVFGVLAAGGCYVPVGVHQPAARQAKIHSAASISLVLTDAAHLTRETSDSILFLDIAQAAHYEPLATPVPVSHSQAAYIIFTSGSTGEPKGVEMAHAATANTIDAITQLYGVHAESRVLAVSALDFDLSVYDLFGVLSVGGAVVVLEEEQRRDATTWLDLIHQHHITLWNSVPVLLEMLLVVAEQDARPLPFEHVLLSGDWIGLDLPARLAAQTTAAPRLVAMGGATEAAIWSNHFEATEPVPAHWRSIPYGKPLPNQAYRVVDAHGRDCPDWVPGELWIGGVGLATGYRGDPQLTAERFVEADGQRWYRTGDRGRYWPDGNLEFLGRIDQQVKVRGHRIELGEIEAALATLPGITRAVAVTVGHPKALAAAVVATAGADLDIDSIRSALHELLPDYMVPTTLAVVDRLPLSANGKVDRQQISVQLETFASNEDYYQPPKDPLERQIADIWREVLHCERISRYDDFFLIGGDSLAATHIVQLLQKRRVCPDSISLLTLFSSPTVAALSERIREQWQTLGVRFDGDETVFEEGTL